MSEKAGRGRVLGRVAGPINAEDITTVPGTPWVVTSGMKSQTVPYGRLYAIDTRDRSAQEIYPYGVTARHDSALYGDSPSQLDPLEFEPHGINLFARPNGGFTLHVVNHEGRESVEIFDFEIDRGRPKLTWIGSVVVPKGCWPNDVASLSDGGFMVTSTADPDGDGGLAGGMARMFGGEEIYGGHEWHPGRGWSPIDGSRMAGANGIAATPDGNVIFIAGWRGKNVTRIDRRGPEMTVAVVQLDILVDNLTWSADGAILAAGAYDTTPDQIFGCFSTRDTCSFPSKVVRIDAASLEAEEVVVYGSDVFGLGTTGLQVGDEIWVSSARDSGVIRFSPAG